MKSLQSFTAVLCTLLVAGLPLSAQEPAAGQSVTLTSPGKGWGGLLGRYQTRSVAPVNISNSSRIDSLLRAGKLYLSLQDCIALVLENNIDIEVQRYGPLLAEADLLRARSGGTVRGVSTSVSAGSSGATGQNSATTSTVTTGGVSTIGTGGPSTGALEPVLSGTISAGHFTSPQTSTFITGTNSLVTRQEQANFTVTDNFLTGTNAQFNFRNTFTDQNNLRNVVNPSTTSQAELVITQHLLQGFGVAVNNRNIRVARNNLRVSDLTFKQQVISSVSNVIGLYWDLVSFNEDVEVKKKALALAEKLYSDNKKQVEIGTLAPIEIIRAEAQVASTQQDLTVSETNVLQQETILKNAISRNGVASLEIAEARIVPTDRIRIPEKDPADAIQDLFGRALDGRPELAQLKIQFDNSKINLTGTKNALRPTLDAYVDLRNNALSGTAVSQPGVPAPSDFFLGGYDNSLAQLFRRNFPDYQVGVQLTIPLKNRAAQADYATAMLNLRQSELNIQKQINSIRLDVQNSVIALKQARSRYDAAVKNRILQEQTLDAEQKKYALGASTVFLVIQAQRDLATAQSNEVTAESTYIKAKVQQDVAVGEILSHNNIEISEAVSGKVSRPSTPTIPR